MIEEILGIIWICNCGKLNQSDHISPDSFGTLYIACERCDNVYKLEVVER